jgi:Asp-tRNA(Asn)/Glu-tRNA(Gln) amidotransferase A subunit family amidase
MGVKAGAIQGDRRSIDKSLDAVAMVVSFLELFGGGGWSAKGSGSFSRHDGQHASTQAVPEPGNSATDGGGSIRIPASFCGVFGMKAQFGRVPVFPSSAAPTLGHVAPMARSVRDVALLLGVISGFDARDPASISGPVPDYLAACEAPIDGMRIAWSPTLGYARPVPEVLEITEGAVRTFEDFGCPVELVEEVMEDPVDLWNAEFYAGCDGNEPRDGPAAPRRLSRRRAPGGRSCPA